MPNFRLPVFAPFMMYTRWSKWRLDSEPKYSSLCDDEELPRSSGETLLEQKLGRESTRHTHGTLARLLVEKIWMAATFILAVATIALALENRSMRRKPTYETGFSTDLG